jgi:CBS domain-containing protein
MSRRVADIMTREVITLNEEDNLTDLARGMDEYHLRHVPVVSGTKLVGLISHRDLLRISVSALEKTQRSRVRDERMKENTFAASIMTKKLHTVNPDTPLLHAVRLMLAGKFGCLPVVDDEGNLVGIISEHDLLKELAKDLQREELEEMG